MNAILVISQQASQFIQQLHAIDPTKEDARKTLNAQLEAYDNQFKQRFNTPTPQHLAASYRESQIYVPVPEEGSEIEAYMKHTFVSDGSVFGQYQHLMRQAKVPLYVPPPPPPPPPDPLGPEELSRRFLRIPYNYQDQNANSKLGQRFFDPYPHVNAVEKYRPLIDNNAMTFYNYQVKILQLQQEEVKPPEAEDPDKKLREALRENINRLGGIEDTIGVMHQSLRDFEVNSSVGRQYKGFMRINPANQVEIQRNGFLYYPEDEPVLKNNEQEHLMHAITQQLEMTQGAQFAQLQQPRHPFRSVIDQQLMEDKQIKQSEHQLTNTLKSLEQSKMLRKTKESSLKM